jgi:hypothetical protein
LDRRRCARSQGGQRPSDSFDALGLAAVLLLFIPVGCNRQQDGTGPNATAGRMQPELPQYDGPPVSDFAVFRPYFKITGQGEELNETVSTAFVFRPDADAEPVMLTVLHPVFLSEQPVLDAATAQAYRSSIREVLSLDAYGADVDIKQFGKVIETSAEALSCGAIEDASASEASASEASASEASASDAASGGNLLHDLVLVASDRGGKGTRPLSLSETGPTVGDTLWMATSVYGGASPSVSAHAATVTEISPSGVLSYEFTNPRLSLQATPGAPLLDAEGKVAGVHITGSQQEGSTVNGMGLSASCVSRWIEGG